MPLSELYRLAKRRVDSHQDIEGGSDVFELVWQNGQIATQGQSSRARRDPTAYALPSPKSRDKDSAGNSATRAAAMNDIPMSVPSDEVVGLSHYDDMIPWLNYPIDCPDFLPEFSGVTIHENPKTNNFAASNQHFRESSTASVDCSANLEQRNGVKPRAGTNVYPTSFPNFRAKFSNTAGDSDSNRVGFSSSKTQKPESVINFSHFSSPSALARASGILQTITSSKRVSMKDKPCDAGAGSSPKLGLIDSGSKLACSGVDLKLMEHSETVFREDHLSKNDANLHQAACGRTAQNLPDSEKKAEPVVASSSVCSANSVERASDALKRRFTDAEDSECHSEDVEEDSVGAKKSRAHRTSSSKRSRAAEVHNLSERRRRDRINEKMRALQELIPNCNKVDKASMLDEAIEYLKTLQLQVQIMSMGTGLCMPPMMLPGMHAPYLAHFSPMMGMGFRMGLPDMNASSAGFFPGAPPLQRGHFPMPGRSPGLHSMSGPGLGITMPMQRPPLMPMMGRPFVNPASYTSKDPAGQNSGPTNPINHPPSQCQATSEKFEQQPSLAQNSAQASDKSGSKAASYE